VCVCVCVRACARACMCVRYYDSENLHKRSKRSNRQRIRADEIICCIEAVVCRSRGCAKVVAHESECDTRGTELPTKRLDYTYQIVECIL